MNGHAESSSSALGASASSRGRQLQVVPRPVSALDLPALQTASRVLQDELHKDTQSVPDLNDLLTVPGIPSSVSYSVFPDDLRVPFQKRKLVSIPEGLFQYYNTTNVTSHMGLMPEIERVWITIDHNLFLWDYVEGQELSSFVDQPDVITHVALVKPKPSVFIDEITSLLVICTPVSVLLIGVSTTPITGPNNRPRKEIKMYATDMSIPCDVEMSSVIGTDDGRIFMCGVQDGCLYELHYQEKEGWFGKRVQIINHSVGGVQSFIPRLAAPKLEDRTISLLADNIRHCFYALTTKNTILVYRTNGEKSVHHLQTLSNLYKAASDKVIGTPVMTPQNFEIISMHVIDPSEARSGVQLMAMTTNGVRLYFAPSSGYYSYGFPNQGGAQTSSRPLQLIHVRLPPPNLLHPDEQARPYRAAVPSAFGISQPPQPSASRPFIVAALEHSCYDSGLTVAAQAGEVDGTDFLLCMSPNLSRVGTLGQVNSPPPPQQPNTQYTNGAYGALPNAGRPPLTEYATMLSIPGRTWAMAPVPRNALAQAIAGPPGNPSPVVANELAYQFSEPTREFMILTNVGVTFLTKRRSLDYLKAVLEEYQLDQNSVPLSEFVMSFGRDQTCAMLLAIASGNTFLDPGEQSPLGTISSVSPELVGTARLAFYEVGDRPYWSERVTYGAAPDGTGTVVFSGRREGLAMYLARLVRPFWKAKLTAPGTGALHSLSIPDDVLITAQKNLFALKEFLDTNPALFHSVSNDHSGVRPTTASEQEAWKVEQSSVFQLISLLARTIEAISFTLLLNDHKLGDLIKQCEADVQQMIASLTYEELITGEKGIAASRALVNVVINQQIGQQISVDTVSEVLQQRCGSFCSTDDVMLYKARENIRKAIETRSPAERQTWLGESLKLFMKGARNLDFEKLREICGDYQQLNYAKGAVELPLHCAQAYDADGLGQEHWRSGCPPNDPRAKAWEDRLHCYELVLDSLSVFEDRCKQQNILEDAERVRSHAYELAFQSEDEMFHSTLYDWLIELGMADELLEMRPAYLEAHLRRHPLTVQKLQLLWQFYVKDGQPLRAAEVLAALAESMDFDLPLDARLEYLTLAVGNAKSHPVSAGSKQETAIAFLTDLEEKLEVAQVQLEILNNLMKHFNDDDERGERVRLLSKGLMSISELYQEYAVPFDMSKVQLLILHVSEHRDENVVRPIWNKLIEDAISQDEVGDAVEKITTTVISLGQRFYPSESAFPLRHIASLLVRFSLAHKGKLPFGWAPRILVQCGVPYPEVWDILYEMYESQIPPFNEQANVQSISSDIAVLLTDWLEDAKRPQSAASRSEFPVYRIDQAVDQYLAELNPSRTETKAAYENIKRQLRRNW